MGLPTPIEREEMYLSNIAGQGTPLPDAPISREEMYLDYIAKNGGGGGTGEGDMKKSVYDSDLDVATAGGIKSYVSGAISDKVDKVSGKGLSTNDYDNTAKGIVDGVTSALDGKVSKSNTAGLLKNDGTVDETHYVSDISGKADKVSSATSGDFAGLDSNGNLTDSGSKASDFATASSVSAILDGTSIDSFADVETALAGKATPSDVAALINDSSTAADKTWSAQKINSVKTTADNAFPRSEQAVLGATNIIPFPYYDGSSKTVDDVVFTVDGYDVKVNGANGNDYPQFQLCTATQLNNLLAKYGNLFISGCPSGGDASTYQIYTQGNNQTFTDRGEGMWLSASITYTTGVNIQMRPNYTANNVVFKPMVSLSDKNPYAEPAMTNRELTEQLNAIFAESLNDGTTFNIPYKRKSNSRNTSGLIVMSGGLYHYFIRPSEQSNTVDVTKILDANSSRSATATFADDVLTVTFNATVPGGITLLTGNKA